jgi:hypothetical protein
MITEFLGRPFTIDAFKARISKKFDVDTPWTLGSKVDGSAPSIYEMPSEKAGGVIVTTISILYYCRMLNEIPCQFIHPSGSAMHASD